MGKLVGTGHACRYAVRAPGGRPLDAAGLHGQVCLPEGASVTSCCPGRRRSWDAGQAATAGVFAAVGQLLRDCLRPAARSG